MLVQRIFLTLALIAIAHGALADYRWNIRTSPVSDAIGIYNFELDYRLNDKFTLGPSFYHFDYELSGVNYDSTAVGIRGNYFFRSVQQGGWLIGMSALYGIFSISQLNSSDSQVYSVDVSTHIYTLMLSYQAVWDNFNITSGAGIAYFTLPNTVVGQQGGGSLSIDTSFLSGTVPTIEFSLGWRF
jgi:hypothetical protein